MISQIFPFALRLGGLTAPVICEHLANDAGADNVSGQFD